MKFSQSTVCIHDITHVHVYPPQEQVDNGVPLATCLYLFGRWVKKIKEERGVVIMEPGKEYSQEMSLCALATWSGMLWMLVCGCTHFEVTSYII